MQLQPTRASQNNLLEGSGARIIAFAREAKVHRQAVRRRKHVAHVERTRRARRRIRATRRARAAADHRRRARREGLSHLLRADVVAMRVDRACGDDELFARNGLGRGADDEGWVDAVHDVWVPGFANADDEAVLHADVSLGVEGENEETAV